VSLPYTEYALAAYYLLMPAEVSSNLARLDGLRLWSQGSRWSDLGSVVQKVSGRGIFSQKVKRRIMLGTYILSAGYYDAYYKQAQKYAH
jgi:aspartyl-tRNA(Asn)/glutamyl-tRNA(Gln) amidotransferase subunit A